MGWILDDLLVTVPTDTGERHLAISIKSNTQVSAAGMPNDFAQAAWKLWLDKSPMSADDGLGLVVGERHPEFFATWFDIVSWCSAGDDAQAISRITRWAKHSRIFYALKAAAPDGPASNEDTIALIRHVRVLSLDFLSTSSESLAESLSRCGTLLRQRTPEAERSLWDELVRLAATARTLTGTLLVTAVWDQLARKYELLSRLQFRSSLDRLNQISADRINGIETSLRNGMQFDRLSVVERVRSKLTADGIVVVHGDSGIGKSSVVKQALATEARHRVVWLGPEEADRLTSTLGSLSELGHALLEVLQAAPEAVRVLVLDSAERLSPDARSRVASLLAALRADESAGQAWKVVIVTQTQALTHVTSFGAKTASNGLRIEPITATEVRAALRRTQSVSWLSAHKSAVELFRNPKTLAWVIEAADSISMDAKPTAPSSIADIMWEYWTEGDLGVQRVLMRLGELDADFVRSFPLSRMEIADLHVIQTKIGRAPISKRADNHLAFEHDLAADWSRFQRLKELAATPDQWTSFAGNPLWTDALRLLGQHLLRTPSQAGTEWDRLFTQLETEGHAIASDILLDALIFDPLARELLEERSDFLFRENGRRLGRLLRRFTIHATDSTVSTELRATDRHLARYLDEAARLPIVRYWPPVVSFLHAHAEGVASLRSAVVAALCELWLTRTPNLTSEGRPYPLRRELAEIALLTAQEIQADKAAGVLYLDDQEGKIYEAALLGIADVTQEVIEWAREMSRRAPMAERTRTRTQARAIELEAQRAVRRRRVSDRLPSEVQEDIGPVVPTPRPLPPWPIGPTDRVDHDFQKVVLHSNALGPMMVAAPDVAAEILLACLVDGRPVERRDQWYSIGQYLGLASDSGRSYPMIFWKSRFFQFLQRAPDAALSALITLVNFATERWASGYKPEPAEIQFYIAGAGTREFVGDADVFAWSTSSDSMQGQLICALDALEKWLFDQVNAGASVQDPILRIFREGKSVALLGVVINILKHSPALVPTMPVGLLASPLVYIFDERRVQLGSAVGYDLAALAMGGESVFNMARDWKFAPFRKVDLVDVVARAAIADEVLGEALALAVTKWTSPTDHARALEQEILQARLTHTNYRSEANDLALGFQPSADLISKVQTYQLESRRKISEVALAHQCDQVLQSGTILSDGDADYLAIYLAIPDQTATDGQQLNQLAAATTIIAMASPEWKARNSSALVTALGLVHEVIGEVTSTRLGEERFSDQLGMVAYAVVAEWTKASDDAWDGPLLTLLTSRTLAAARNIGSRAFAAREHLGSRWYWLLRMSSLWSALSMLGGQLYESPAVARRWQRWLVWLRRQKAGYGVSNGPPDFPDLLRRLNRLLAGRKTRRPDGSGVVSIDTGFIGAFLSWLTASDIQGSAVDRKEDHELLLSLWGVEVAVATADREPDSEIHTNHYPGYDLVARLAHQAARASDDQMAAEAWHAIIELGPAAKFAVTHFMGVFFLQIHDPQVATSIFFRRWRSIIEFTLSDSKWASGPWHLIEDSLQHVMGLYAEASLRSAPMAAVELPAMADLYEKWARGHLGDDHDNYVGLCSLATSPIGVGLRRHAVLWISTALTQGTRKMHGRDAAEAGEAIAGLLDLVLSEQQPQLLADAEYRAEFLKVSALLVAWQLPSGMSLQQRIQQLR